MRWDEMRWDKIRWDKMRWDEARSASTHNRNRLEINRTWSWVHSAKIISMSEVNFCTSLKLKVWNSEWWYLYSSTFQWWNVTVILKCNKTMSFNDNSMCHEIITANEWSAEINACESCSM